MKKLTVLVVILLVAGLLAGCWVTPTSKLDYIEVEPDDVILSHYVLGQMTNTQQLEVTAYYDDKTSADVTPNCDYNSSLSNTASVTNEGLITGVEVGEAIILVTYTQHNLWTGRIIRTTKVKVTVK